MLLSEWEGSKTGFQNSYHQAQRAKEDERAKPPLPIKDPGFELFCEFFSYPAYSGLFQWQKDHHKLTWDAKFEMTLVHRKAGKSVLYNNKYQWAIQYKNFDVLLLGWTSRYKEIAVYVYNFFEFYGEIETDRRTTPFHFRTKNGGRFDCFLITSKETLGMHSEGLQDRFEKMSQEDWETYKSLFHGNFEKDEERIFNEQELKEFIESRKGSERKLWISIDDPIDISFMKERHKEETLELHFNSTLYGIQPDKWSFTGTRKFEGDFFDFISSKFGDKLIKYIEGTIKIDGSLLCPEMFTHPKLLTYQEDLKKYYINENGDKIDIIPKEDLSEIRADVGEYVWFSDYEQDPHPITGEVWDYLAFESLVKAPRNRFHDICFITIDRATTTKKTSALTGCVIGLREIGTGNRIIIDDYSGKISLDQLLIKINDFVIKFRAQEPNINIIIVVETQGGGNDFITMANNIREFIKEDGSKIQNMIAEISIIVPVHNTGDKEGRIKDRLLAPIINEKIRFLNSLRNSEIVKEILNFPHSAKLDAIDALANSEYILLTRFFETIDNEYIKKVKRSLKQSNKEEELTEKKKEELQKFGLEEYAKKTHIFDDF